MFGLSLNMLAGRTTEKNGFDLGLDEYAVFIQRFPKSFVLSVFCAFFDGKLGLYHI